MVTKTYIPSNLCDSSDSIDNSDSCDSSDSSDSSLLWVWWNLKNLMVMKLKNSNCDKIQKF